MGVAYAFFARGIPNFIGTGWQVDDACARIVRDGSTPGRWGYRSRTDAEIATSPPATIGEALRDARRT